MCIKIDEKKIEAIKIFLNSQEIGEYTQPQIRSGVWHIIDGTAKTIDAILAGVDDAILGGYGL